MAEQRFTSRVPISAPASELAAWHKNPLAFERLTPPFERFTSLTPPVALEEGLRVKVRVSAGPVAMTLESCITEVGERHFVDEQVHGPFKRWRHEHRFLDDGPGRSILEDDITYTLPLGGASAPARPYVEGRLERMFRYRHDVTAGDLRAHHGQKRRTVAITGATGFVGTALIRYLRAGGHDVIALARPGSRANPDATRTVPWDPREALVDPSLSGIDAVVHLAGEPVAGRWNDAKKARILESREQATRTLAEGLARLEEPPSVLVSASGVGMYGEGGDAVLDEGSPSGDTFLAEVCRAWEAASDPARDAGVRVVHPRIGAVLDPSGGALAEMLTPAKAGIGGPLGSGQQWMSWISMDDLLDVLWRAVVDDRLSGPVNAVADDPRRQRELARVLGHTLGRPAFTPVPAFVLRAMFAGMANEAILISQRVKPGALLAVGHRFRHPRLEEALAHVLGR